MKVVSVQNDSVKRCEGGGAMIVTRKGNMNRLAACFLLGLLVVCGCDNGPPLSTLLERFEPGIHRGPNGQSLPFRLLTPVMTGQMADYPLLLVLHGAGERGSDNAIQVCESEYVPFWAAESTQQRFPSFILVPQCPADSQWVNVSWYRGSYGLDTVPVSGPMGLAMSLLDSLVAALPVDTARIYVTGLSMGGYGVWDLVMRRPKRFAAAVPICGGGDPSQAAAIAAVGVWAFHGALGKGDGYRLITYLYP